MGTDLQPSHCMGPDRSAAESQNASARPTGALDESLTKSETAAAPLEAKLVSRDLTVRLVEQVIFVTAVIGAVSLGMGITAYFAEHRYLAAYLLAYIGFRFADLLVGEDSQTMPPAQGLSERVLNELPVLIL